jgi:hypothetical protein
VKMIEQAQDLKCAYPAQVLESIHWRLNCRDGQAFPLEYLDVLSGLWKDPSIQRAIARGNEAALPEKYVIIPFCIIHWRLAPIASRTSSMTLLDFLNPITNRHDKIFLWPVLVR